MAKRTLAGFYRNRSGWNQTERLTPSQRGKQIVKTPSIVPKLDEQRQEPSYGHKRGYLVSRKKGAMNPIVRLKNTIFAGRKVTLPIPRGARVLEVGGGDSPSPRSDVLVDFALEPRERWGGRIERDDRPLVLARGEALPFREKSFDYVIAFHVLEHSDHPEMFLSELQRVASAGYIETPSFWSERVLPFSVHRLEVAAIDDDRGPMLMIRKKAAPVCDPLLMRAFKQKMNEGALTTISPEAWVTRFHWKDRIRYTVVNPEVESVWQVEPASHDNFNPRTRVRRILIAGAATIFALRRRFRDGTKVGSWRRSNA
jgi:SAM-dependent methyltransferase